MLLVGCGGPETSQTESDVVDGEAGDPPPYFVSLSRSSARRPFCSGTLIDDDIVLTAAHCVKGDRRYFGVDFPTRSREDSWRWESRRVEAVLVHERYETVADAAYDVALIRLAEPAPSRSDGRRVSTIWRAGSTPTEGELDIMGFGNATNFGWLRANDFQVATATVQSECKYEDALCVGRDGGAGTGSGDSGGPVVRRQWNGSRLVGVVSAGNGELGFYAPVAELEDWIDEKMAQLHRPGVETLADVIETFETHCHAEPFELEETDDQGRVTTRIEDVGLTRAIIEVDRATYDTPSEALQPGTWIEQDRGCGMFLPDESFLHRKLALHPATGLVRLRAYLKPDEGDKRYFEVLGSADMIPAVAATATNQTWLSLDMGRTAGWLAEPSGAGFQVQPRGEMTPAGAAPASARAVFRVGETELRLFERDGKNWTWWSSPLFGTREGRVVFVVNDDDEDGAVSAALSIDGGRVAVEVFNHQSSDLVAWELTCSSRDTNREETFGPYLPETHPEIGRIPAGQTVRVTTEVSLEAVPADYACELNGIEVPLTRR